MIDVCMICGKRLADCETIWAVEGSLYCSAECGTKATECFNDLAEEINPVDIGLSKNYTVVIEETLVTTIQVRAATKEEAEQQVINEYNSGELIVNESELQTVRATILDEEDQLTDAWFEL